MKYIIFDLEFNQGFNFKKSNKKFINQNCPFEIIQIGAIKIDENFEAITTINKLIKPKIYKRIHPVVKKLTGITEEQLSEAEPFEQIYKQIVDILKDDKNIFCMWGTSDLNELFRNINFHKLDASVIPREYIDVQAYTSKYFKCDKGTHLSLKAAVEKLSIPITEKFHDAYSDAFYTTEIFKKIYTDNIEPKVYEPKSTKKTQDTKSKIDTPRLFRQFEKMFKRKMNKDEKRMIKLAYMMGRTNQFQLNSDDKSE